MDGASHGLTVLAAAGLAAGQLAMWAALGSWVAGADRGRPVSLDLAVLYGSGITAALLAVFCRAGLVGTGLAVVLALGVVALAARRRRLGEAVRGLGRDVGGLVREQRWLAWVGAGLLAIYAVNAASPPRDADVLRYHLAHVRQILQDGGWVPLPDYHYALPFGWSLNYLGFEALGQPQAAHFVNLYVWLLVLAGVLVWLRERRAAWPGALLAVALAFHPIVVKAVTTAGADAYTMLVVFAVARRLVEPAEPGPGAGRLGFAAWIGAQSRYQLVAVGLVVSALALARRWRRTWTGPALAAFGRGAGLALALGAPFYAVNLLAFANPVWPMLIPWFNRSPSYGDRVGALYHQALVGRHDLAYAAGRLGALLLDPVMAPIPVALLALLACWWAWAGPVRVLGGLAAALFALWMVAQPLLNPRFVLLFLPIVLMAGGLLVSGWLQGRRVLARAAIVVLTALGATLGSVSVAYSRDGLAWLATGDADAFHRFTWYYPVYQWVNRATRPEARVLVIVDGGQSYHLARRHRRGDPFLSGVVDWERTRTVPELQAALREQGFDWVVYDRGNDWSRFLGGAQMETVIRLAMEAGVLRLVRSFEVQLATERLRRRFQPTTVWVLQVPAHGGG